MSQGTSNARPQLLLPRHLNDITLSPNTTPLCTKNATSHLLAQVPLTVSPFINLPKPPTLPHNYTSLPSTLPPSILQSTPSSSSQQQSSTSDPLPAYVTSPQSHFSAHPSAIIAQNKALLDRLTSTPEEARKKVEAWEAGIEERELQEKRRRAPGWLDRDEKILSPARKAEEGRDLLGDEEGVDGGMQGRGLTRQVGMGERRDQGGELGEAMDRAFGGLG
ncbi:hypothetical protein C1H76_0862 [Elsinoe australis]|uniref:Uncharacterized protein n=1 Tax=Elsinoe australis TaxID=40998 RepID=A0A4U7B5N2_9PEZI|nr:hypothetical protein C1H76_0862 [Elsinoe australis]